MWHVADFAVSSEHKMLIKETKKREKYLNLARELKKAMKPESDGDTNCNWCAWNNLRMLWKEARRVGNWRTNQEHPN